MTSTGSRSPRLHPVFAAGFEYMMMPQVTAQYGPVLRVSIIPASLNGRVLALGGLDDPEP